MLTSGVQQLAGLTGWRRWLMAFLAGALTALGTPPFDFSLIGFLTFPVLVILLDGSARQAVAASRWSGLRSAGWTGWWFGFGYFVAGLWWIGTAFLIDAEEFAWALPLAVLGLPAILAIFYGFACALAALLWRPGLVRLLALAAGFALAEWLRSFLFTGFPWNAIGYAVMPMPLLMQTAALVGLVGMSAYATFIFAAPSLLFGGRLAKSGLGLAIALMLMHVGYGAWILSNAPDIGANPSSLAVRIVQPSIPQEVKFDNEQRRAVFDQYIAMTKSPPAAGQPEPQIIVWPETAVPYILSSTPEALAVIGATLKPGQLLLAGAVREENSADGSLYFNSILTINDQGQIVAAADKVHLVPFGEYLPFENILRWLGIQELVQMPGGFTAAPQHQQISLPSGASLYPLICYEAIFPGEVDFAGSRPSAFVNVTNDAWYGDTPGPHQHFRQAQLRAVEYRTPLIRAANNGVSAVVDRYGRIIASLPLNAVGVIDVYLPSTSDPKWSTSSQG